MAVDLLPKRDIVEQIIPVDAASAAVNVGASWAWGSWFQVVASCPNDFVLVGIMAYEIVSSTATPNVVIYQLEIGTGAAASESTIAAVGSGILATSSGSAETKNTIHDTMHFVTPTFIPSGTRIAARATSSVASGFLMAVMLMGYDARDYAQMLRQPRHDRYLRGRQGRAAAVYPSAGVTTVSSLASVWGYGSWVEFDASAEYPLLVKGIVSGHTDSSLHAVFDVGVGAASSEVTHLRLPFASRQVFPGPGLGISYAYRPMLVRPGERTAVRVKDSSSLVKNYSVMLLVDEVK